MTQTISFLALRGVRLAVVLALLAVVAGCGTSDPFAHVNVAGKVTYDDGSLIPAERIVVTFLPQTAALDEKTHPRPGQANVNVTDGSFAAATTYKQGDGIVAGRHKVLVQSYDALGTPTAVVPPEFGDASLTPLEIDTASSPLEIKVRKP